MFLDLRRLSDGHRFETDLCIVGAGAAGISLAREMLGSRYKVILLESGDFDVDAQTAALNEADSAGDLELDLESFRARQFGGTTSLWGGNCAPLDPLDFIHRPWVHLSGWPVKHAQMEAYWKRAQSLFELTDRGFDPDEWAQAEPDFAELRLPLGGDLVQEKLYQRSPRTHFGRRYRADFQADDTNVTVLLDATAVALDTTEDIRSVREIKIRTLTGHTHTVAARAFVLAAGIENARLLLLSNDRAPAGLGNAHDTVGRYFMEHLSLVSGRLLIPNASSLYRFYDPEGWADRRWPTNVPMVIGLQPTPEMQETKGIGNYAAFVNRTFDGEESAGYHALRRIVADLKHRHLNNQTGNDVEVLLRNFGSALRASWNRLTGSETSLYQIQHFFEQVPNPDSRIRLSDIRDPLGQPRLVAEWRTLDQDKLTWAIGQDVAARAIGAGGSGGRLQLEPAGPDHPWPESLRQSSHFMGTTRMSENPHEGVVDANCRVHGLSNLFIAGGSVLPTGGCAMVTINIVALALRLADHLKIGLA
ncbi:choline dehydrogenase-like flavoprotein [Skermanella aerolata]|uniref:FAD-dependent oxidoreductase n=1 Tax=Skermanella aerolata TaxID=393310 RepID=UPI003D227053